MADIRINALATTAASTASDDFIAVDGSANGTRKLNAYSPTFGGNLTVSGTGQSTFGGNLSATGEISCNGSGGALRADSRTGSGLNWYIYNPTGADLRFYNSTGGNILTLVNAGNATLAGNLTVSGGETVVTGNVPWYSAKFTGSTGRTGGGVRWLWSDGTNPVAIISRNTTADDNLEFYTGSALRATLNSSGNFLIGTTTDVGAKVYSKVADGVISIGASGTTKGIRFAHASTYSSIDGVDSSLSGSYQPLQINGSTVQIATNGGTVAASFDSSQNATFAGVLEATTTNAAPFRATGATTGASTIQFTNTGGTAIFGQENSAGNNYIVGSTGYDTVVRGPSGLAFSANAGSALHLRISNAGNATFAGTIKPQLAATASAPTYVKGAIYFDTTLNKLRVGGATGWETITSV